MLGPYIGSLLKEKSPQNIQLVINKKEDVFSLLADGSLGLCARLLAHPRRDPSG